MAQMSAGGVEVYLLGDININLLLDREDQIISTKQLEAKFMNTNAPLVAAPQCREYFSFQIVAAEEVFKMLSALRVKKAHGLDDILARVLRIAAAEPAFPTGYISSTILAYDLHHPLGVEIRQSHTYP